MPVFKWNAIDLGGRVYRGIDFANNQTELTSILQLRYLGLMYCSELRKDIFVNKIRILDQLNFFHDLFALLESGMLLPQALQLLLNQSKNESLRCIIGYLLYQIQNQGQNFGNILHHFKAIFGNLIVVVLQSGFNVSNLSQALKNVCHYLENKLQMQRELRRAILMPALTLVLFFLITALVFIVIIPQFATIFENAKIPLDMSTKMVLKLSLFFRSLKALVLLLTILLNGLILHLIGKTKIGKRFFHTILIHLPLINTLIIYQNLFSFLQSAAILIDGGVPVLEAFECAQFSINNVILQQQANHMTKLVERGTPITNAMQEIAPKFFLKKAIAMIAVGEESGCLGKMLARAAEVYQQLFRIRLQLILSLLQPTLVICLGLMVALLIFAIYIPIFNMPAIMG